MAGALAIVERETTQNPTMATRERFRWQAKYSRYFTYPSYSSSGHHLLSSIKRNYFKPTWLTSSGFSTVLLVSSNGDSSGFILTVALQGFTMEEHFISKLHFFWPQVSSVSGLPDRGSLIVLASYVDGAGLKQKFALWFSTLSEVEDFMNTLKNILSSEIPDEIPNDDVISAMSSQSESVPPYRPDTSVVIYASPVSRDLYKEDQLESQTQDRDAYSESNAVAFPPRFTSLVSNCSAEMDRGASSFTVAAEPGQLDLKSEIVKYFQDPSFLDMVNKVSEVIDDLRVDYAP